MNNYIYEYFAITAGSGVPVGNAPTADNVARIILNFFCGHSSNLQIYFAVSVGVYYRVKIADGGFGQWYKI